jgi:sec-independent protein translocase protein TatC
VGPPRWEGAFRRNRASVLGKTSHDLAFHFTVRESDDQPDDSDPYGEPPPAAREKAMGFWEHLEELRGTLIKCAVVFAIFAGLIAYFIREFNAIISGPLQTLQARFPEEGIRLATISPMEGLNVFIKVCVLGGLVTAAPFILFFIGQFVAPALTPREKRAVWPLCVAALVLFLAGAAFSFRFLVPSTLRVSVEVNKLFDFGFNWTPGNYYSLLMWLVLGVGGAFEFPLLIILLVHLGIMSTAFLRKYRRHAIVVIFIIAAIVTPTPDPFLQTFFAAPLYLLYEIAIIASARIEKRRAAELNA